MRIPREPARPSRWRASSEEFFYTEIVVAFGQVRSTELERQSRVEELR
jgi:hypothetical protein